MVSAIVSPGSIRSGRNSPITSPWEVFTSSPTITVIGLPSAAASSAPETSLWSVIAIAPRPWAMQWSTQRLGLGRAVVEWHVCMCRSTEIVVRAGGGAAAGAAPAASRARA